MPIQWGFYLKKYFCPMNLQERIQGFTKLGEYLKTDIYQEAEEQLHLAEALNPWFTKENITRALNAWQEQLSANMLSAWLSPYKLKDLAGQKKVLIIMAGNIPLVGFHDFITVLILGHKVVVKMSSTDNVLLKVIIEKLISIAPDLKENIFLLENLIPLKIMNIKVWHIPIVFIIFSINMLSIH